MSTETCRSFRTRREVQMMRHTPNDICKHSWNCFCLTGLLCHWRASHIHGKKTTTHHSFCLDCRSLYLHFHFKKQFIKLRPENGWVWWMQVHYLSVFIVTKQFIHQNVSSFPDAPAGFEVDGGSSKGRWLGVTGCLVMRGSIRPPFRSS